MLVPLPASEDGQTGSVSVLREKSMIHRRAHPGKEEREAATGRREKDRQTERGPGMESTVAETWM